jgi:hypothetical protein
MNYEFKKFPFLTVALFAGVFTGFILSFVNLVFDLIYRGITDYSYSKIINALSIIIISMLLLLVAGLIYFFLVKYIKKGSLVYSALYITGTILLCIFLASQHYPQPYAGGFKWLLVGVTSITGIFAAFLVPYFAKHSNTFL